MKHLDSYYNPLNNILLDVSFGLLRYDRENYVFVPLKRIREQERRVLASLTANEGVLVTRKMLLAEAWEGRVVTDNTINVTISRLRGVLKNIDPDAGCIKTMRNSGFIFSIRNSDVVSFTSKNFLLTSICWAVTNGCDL